MGLHEWHETMFRCPNHIQHRYHHEYLFDLTGSTQLECYYWCPHPIPHTIYRHRQELKITMGCLADTYGKTSRDCILALRNCLHSLIKGSSSITDFMLEIKGVVDELYLLGVVTDVKDLALKILNGF